MESPRESYKERGVYVPMGSEKTEGKSLPKKCAPPQAQRPQKQKAGSPFGFLQDTRSRHSNHHRMWIWGLRVLWKHPNELPCWCATTVPMDPGPLNARVHLQPTRIRTEFTPNGKTPAGKRVGSVRARPSATMNRTLRGIRSTRSVCPPTLVPTIPIRKGRGVPPKGKMGGGVTGKR